MNNDFARTIQEIANELLSAQTNRTTIRNAKNFIKDIFEGSPKNAESIDWVLFCSTAKRNNASAFAFYFLCSALRNNLSFGEYTSYLISNRKLYEEMLSFPNVNHPSILCEKRIRNQIICRTNRKDSRYSYYYIDTNNEYIVELVKKFFDENPTANNSSQGKPLFYFAKSFKDKETTISSFKDLKCEMIHGQAEYYRRIFPKDSFELKMAFQFLCYFYRWLVNSHKEHDFFRGSLSISASVLFNQRFTTWLNCSYYFTTFNPTNLPLEHSKILFLTSGLNRVSTKQLEEGYFSIDLTDLHSLKYRKLLLSYLLSATSVYVAKSHFRTILVILEALFQNKQNSGCGNPDLEHMTIDDACLVRNIILQRSEASSTKMNRINGAKLFFEWCNTSGYMTFEPTFFYYFGIRKATPRTSAKSIPDKELEIISNDLLAHCSSSIKTKLVYAIFHLLLNTELRISQICTLKISDINRTLKNEYFLCSNSKTSRGDPVECVITEKTYRILNDVIKETEELRSHTNPTSIAEYIFIYTKEVPFGKTSVINNEEFNAILAESCKRTGIKEYTASNIRDTRMTKTWEYIIENKRSDIELSLLTKHKQISTTEKHYLELDLEKMLEATYEVEIGNITVNAEDKVIKEVPSELNLKSRDVENGCGKCSAAKCDGNAVLSCLVCKRFVTTPNHEPYFRKALNQIQQQILRTNCKHEKDDLTTIKSIYTAYLKAIYLHQESNK